MNEAGSLGVEFVLLKVCQSQPKYVSSPHRGRKCGGGISDGQVPLLKLEHLRMHGGNPFKP